MQTERDKIISLLQSENPDNVVLGHELEESLGIDLSDFWIDLEEIHRLVTEETYQRPYESIFPTIPDCDELLAFTRSVTTLKLSNRNLTALPSAVKYLYNLTTLELNNNAFTEIPVSVFKFSQLRLLALNNNKIKDEIEIGKLK
ncbi:MAG: hypothetical protein MK212_18215 [Saprospiraceae bacterium]|nr:hypothetical protein [Saprospiraceae bacterium]